MREMPEEVACRALDIIKRLAKDESSLSDKVGDYFIAAMYDIEGFGILIYPERAFNQPNVLNIYANNRDGKYTLEELDWR